MNAQTCSYCKSHNKKIVFAGIGSFVCQQCAENFVTTLNEAFKKDGVTAMGGDRSKCDLCQGLIKSPLSNSLLRSNEHSICVNCILQLYTVITPTLTDHENYRKEVEKIFTSSAHGVESPSIANLTLKRTS